MAEKTRPTKVGGPKAPAEKTVAKTGPEGERIAKVLSRSGVASRREAERMIELGEVSVNGKVITSPALNVTPKDRITIRGELMAEPEPPRLWLYYKPEGLVTSESDEKGRDTVFNNLPEELPRVMSVGRLDLNSEGLLLLTNDGELKRRLELPSTGWLRKYRVRVNGNPTDPDLEPLRKGITVDGEKFQPMSVVLDRIQGANAWLTVGIREGRNREIRRAMSAINLTVNRLIRVSYGPFRLGELQPGQVEEIRAKVLREQLGDNSIGDVEEAAPKPARKPTTRRLPAGEGLKQLSQAWQDATTPGGRKPAAPRKASGETARTKPAGRATTTARSTEDTAPRGPRKPSPRTGSSTGFGSTKPGKPRVFTSSRSSDEDSPRKAAPRSSSSAKPASARVSTSSRSSTGYGSEKPASARVSTTSRGGGDEVSRAPRKTGGSYAAGTSRAKPEGRLSTSARGSNEETSRGARKPAATKPTGGGAAKRSDTQGTAQTRRPAPPKPGGPRPPSPPKRPGPKRGG